MCEPEPISVRYTEKLPVSSVSHSVTIFLSSIKN